MTNVRVLVCVAYQVGDMVHMVKTSACFPLPSPVKFKPSSDIVSIPNSSGRNIFQKISLSSGYWQAVCLVCVS